MIEVFCIVSMIFMIGYIFAGAAKGVGKKISSLTAPCSGCKAYLEDDGKHYTLSYIGHIGSKLHIESAWVRCGSARNHVVSLEYSDKVFRAVVMHKEFVPDRVIEEKDFEARTIKKLADNIEGQFREWDTKDGSAYLWEYPYL